MNYYAQRTPVANSSLGRAATTTTAVSTYIFMCPLRDMGIGKGKHKVDTSFNLLLRRNAMAQIYRVGLGGGVRRENNACEMSSNSRVDGQEVRKKNRAR